MDGEGHANRAPGSADARRIEDLLAARSDVESVYQRKGERVMARFISLLNWTDHWSKTADDTVARAEEAQKVAAEMGGSLQIYWTMGQYDMVLITEFADDETQVAFLAKASSLGNVRSETMRAFDAEGIRSITGKI
jgi:uncharacterized protein with GYD domain